MPDSFLNRYNSPPLDERSLNLRKLVIRAFEGGQRGHLGSSMSLIEIMRVLFDDFLKFDISNPHWEFRDRLILSKGHGCLALYVLLADKGFIKPSNLETFCHFDSILGGHPEFGKVPGVEASTGSLGHGMPIGVGMAIALKIRKMTNKVVVVLGDGEMNEGSNWEAALSASKHNLNNLITIIDYNKLQSYGETREVLDLEPLVDKCKSFGFKVTETDGHNINKIKKSLSEKNFSKTKPNMIICHTVKGKGFPFAEHNPSWHHKSNMSQEDVNLMYQHLEVIK